MSKYNKIIIDPYRTGYIVSDAPSYRQHTVMQNKTINDAEMYSCPIWIKTAIKTPVNSIYVVQLMERVFVIVIWIFQRENSAFKEQKEFV